MSISKKPRSKSRKPATKEPQSLIIKEQTAWPENPDGCVVPQKESEDFIDNHSLLKAQITARRFMVVADAGTGQNAALNNKLIRRAASHDKSEAYQKIMKAMVKAIEAGEQGIMTACCATRHPLEYGFERAACCNREKPHQDNLKRVSRAPKSFRQQGLDLNRAARWGRTMRA